MRAVLLVLLLPAAAAAQPRVRIAPEGSHRWRIIQASRLLRRPLTRSERAGVALAHRVGRGEAGKDGTPARLYNYTFGQVKRKIRVLKDAGFPQLERRKLIMSGLCGARRGPLRGPRPPTTPRQPQRPSAQIGK